MSTPTAAIKRLHKLPRKQALPLIQILDVGQISEDVLTDILDAGELAGNPPTLLGFAVGYLYLRSQAVPIRDVIRMARSQDRRVNLRWSAARWQAEHDRLARAETLLRLAGENVQYDVSDYAEKLPAGFKGYLIRSSRRLGMEGLRQRHCVASYHLNVSSGACAICVTFVNRKRWTVQLAPSIKKEDSLRIVQIRTRHNEYPSREVRLAICRALGVEEDTGAEEPMEAGEQPPSYMDTLRAILPVLRTHRVKAVCVSFDGCGDSGSIDGISFGESGDLVGDIEVDIARPVLSHRDGHWNTTFVQERSTLHAAVEDLANQYIDKTGVNWYDQDGGYGELVIDVEAGTVSLEINSRYTESRGEYCETLDIVTGEEL